MNDRFLVHMNGDSAADLRDQHLQVMLKAQELLSALKAAAPNMRNYYPLEGGEAIFKEDAATWRDMYKQVDAIGNWALEGVARAEGNTLG